MSLFHCQLRYIWYAQVVDGFGLALRPDWSVKRVSLVLQAMLDGFVLRYCVQPDDYPTSRHEGVSIFADAVVAFILVWIGRRPG